MEVSKLRIEGIPAMLWGPASNRMILAAHGSHSSKIDECIWVLAEEAAARGYQVLSFDFPQHGERVYEKDFIMPDQCAHELQLLYRAASARAQEISLFGCSMGAYFELLALAEVPVERVWFLSPVTDMERIIQNMMRERHVTEQELQEKVWIDHAIEPLYYPYYMYVKQHPIQKWPHPTHILRGEHDTLCEYDAVARFAAQFGCELVEQKGGEHWFHTEEELDFFRSWLRKSMEHA